MIENQLSDPFANSRLGNGHSGKVAAEQLARGRATGLPVARRTDVFHSSPTMRYITSVVCSTALCLLVAVLAGCRPDDDAAPQQPAPSIVGRWMTREILTHEFDSAGVLIDIDTVLSDPASGRQTGVLFHQNGTAQAWDACG